MKSYVNDHKHHEVTTTNAIESDDYESGNRLNFWVILSVIRNSWLYILLFSVLLLIVTLMVLSKVTPVYNATSVLEVKQQERQIIDVSGIESITADKEFVSTQIELLKSEALLIDVIETLNLLSDPFFINLEDPDIVILSREKRTSIVVNNLRGKLKVSLIGLSRLIRVSAEHSSPEKAALIANTLTKSFISNELKSKQNSIVDGQDILRNRLSKAKESLEHSERKLAKYALENDIIIIDNGNNQETNGTLDMATLKSLNVELAKATTEALAAEQIYLRAKALGPSTEILENDVISRLTAERVTLDSEYLEKLAYFKPDYPDMLELKARINLYEQQIETEINTLKRTSLEELEAAFEVAKTREINLKKRINSLKDSIQFIRQKSIDYDILKREVETERVQYDALLQRFREVSMSHDIGDSLVQIVDSASSPLSPFKPNKPLLLVLTGILSIGIGTFAAFAYNAIDDRIESPEDIIEKLKSNILSVVLNEKDENSIIRLLSDSRSGLSEGYATLRTNLQFSKEEKDLRVVQITSTQSGEGKSVSSLGLALRYAGLGENVLLIDCDMRLPTFSQGSDVTSKGLSGLLASTSPFKDIIRPTLYENLDLIAEGMPVDNPTELLSSNRFYELLQYARENYAYVVLDSPPILGLADAGIIGSRVDATILVVESGRLRSKAIKSAINRLQTSGTKILGVVLTKYKNNNSTYENYYTYSHVTDSQSGGKTFRKRTKAAKKKRKLVIV